MNLWRTPAVLYVLWLCQRRALRNSWTTFFVTADSLDHLEVTPVTQSRASALSSPSFIFVSRLNQDRHIEFGFD